MTCPTAKVPIQEECQCLFYCIFWTNIDFLIFFFLITDHSTIGIKFNSVRKTDCDKTKVVLSRCLSKQSYEDINLKLLEYNFNNDSSDVNILYSDLSERCENVVNTLYPVREILNKNIYVPWYDQEVGNLVKERDRAYKKYVNYSDSNNSRELWGDYKNKRNGVTNLLKQKKANYYENKIDQNKDNCKEMWRCLKNLVKKPNVEISFSNVNFGTDEERVMAVNEYQGACMFNEYFIDSINEIANSIMIPRQWSCDNLPVIECRLDEFQPLNLLQLKEIVFSIKKSNSVDNILNSNFLKETFCTMGYVLLNLINTSLETGVFPRDLRTSSITPIQKEQKKFNIANFRPVNTLPCIEKLLEKAVHHQLSEYFNANNLFLGNQSGFRRGHSCETAIQLTITKWKLLIDKDKYVIAIFLDLKRAFETINRELLMEKFKYYGIGGKVLKWFSEYLSDRKQNVHLGKSKSSDLYNDIGVPQGSVLGALLFIIYLNDINYVEELEFINLFADDTLIACSGQNLHQMIEKMNRVLKNVEMFFKINKLKLNPEKTKAMILGGRNKIMNLSMDEFKLNIEEKDLEWVEQIKYLGFVIDNTLSLKKHCEYIQRKISKKLFFFSRVARDLSMYARITVFKTIIQPHFDYCATLLYMADNSSVQSLQVLFNRGMRIILRCSRYTSIRMMLSVLNWFSVSQRLYYFTMIFVFKLSRGMLPSYFDEFATLRGEIHSYNTRQIDDFHVSRTRYSSTMCTIVYRGLSEFNLLPGILKSVGSLKEFKRKLKDYIFCK